MATLFVGGVAAVPAAVLRIARTPRARRGPLLWAAGNAALFGAALVAEVLAGLPQAWLAAALAIPVATAVGVVRYGLYDIGLLAHRSLLYGTLTIAGIAGYGGAAALLAWLVPPAGAPVAVAATAVALLPLRQGLQRLLARGLYGSGARPDELLSAIGRATAPGAELASAVTALVTGARLPYAAVWLDGEPAPRASHGRRRPWPVTGLRLTYRGDHIGRLVVQRRAPDEGWSTTDRRLLDGLCAQFGPLAAAALLADDLHAARTRLARVREDEAGRLRRDLHDGVGPALSGARMLLLVGRRQAADAGTRRTLDELERGLAGAAAEIRRIVDNLRPPALDDGLAAALETAVRRHTSAGLVNGLDRDAHGDSGDGHVVRLVCTGDLSSVPEEVRVAAYRVVDEALTNVLRHAHASAATVTVARAAAELRIEVADDGVGGAAARPGGVGLDSMRRRCQDLGGSFRITDRAPGTLLTAIIPLSP
ncbi:histidine kinase [Actinomycetes bacterium KLBMP 9797]